MIDVVLPRASGTADPADNGDDDRRDTVRDGSRGSDVQALQRYLKIPDDGIFGAMTEAAVKTFQMAQGLTIDGIAGPNTWGRIDEPRSVHTKQISQFLPFTIWLRSPHSFRSQYQALTRILNIELLLPASPVFSEISDAAARGFQRGADLTVDGMVGRQTWGTLFFGAPDD